MIKKQREHLVAAVEYKTIWDVQEKFNKFSKRLLHDETYFDYKLLLIALKRNNPEIVNFLLDSGCRAAHPNMEAHSTPLHLALKTDCNIITKILENGGSIYDRNRKGETPIFAGFNQGFYNVVFALLNYSCSNRLTHRTKDKLTPTNRDALRHFHIACILSNLKAVEEYINYGFDINTLMDSDDFPDHGARNPVHYAVEKNDPNLFELLLKKGADLTVKDRNGHTPLHNIYHHGFRVQSLVQKAFIFGNNTKFHNIVDSLGVSPLHVCCMLNYPDFVQEFIYKGADVNAAISSKCLLYPGCTPLHLAVEHNCNHTVNVLLKNGANPNLPNAEGSTPLHLACEKTSIMNSSLTISLLKYKADPAAADKKGVTPLHMAFYKSTDLRECMVDKFIAKVPFGVNPIDDKGLSYFHIICTRNELSRVYDYIYFGVDVNSCVLSGFYCRYTALHLAVMYQQKDVVKILLEKNAQVNAKTGVHKLTPLHIAFQHYIKSRAMGIKYDYEPARSIWKNRCQIQLDIINLLFEFGADVDAHDSSGKTPLMQVCTDDAKSCLKHHFNISNELELKKCITVLQEIIEILLSHKANVNVRAKRQFTLLHFFTHKCTSLNKFDEWLIEFLISNGASVNVADSTGMTPLHHAVQATNINLVLLLLKHKADVNATTKNSTTVLEMAIRRTDEYPDRTTRNVLRAILEYDVDVNVRNKHGHPLFQECIRHRMMYPIRRLLECGVDIHMEDLAGKPTYSTMLEWETELTELHLIAEPEYPKIIRLMFIHIQKLLALGLPVDSDVQRSCIRLLHRYESAVTLFDVITTLKYRIDFKQLELVFDKCVKELERMKLVRINNRTSLYDVLQSDVHTLSNQVRNSNLVKIMADEKSYPFYFSLLKLQYRKACIRRNETEDAVAALSHISGFYFPNPCCDLVLKLLNLNDLVNLNLAIDAKKGSKRKLNDEEHLDSPSSKEKLKPVKRSRLKSINKEDLSLD